MLKPDGTVSNAQTTLKYSPKNKKYYIRVGKYKTLKEKGVILCRVTHGGTPAIGKLFGPTLKDESFLHEYGYTVNKIDGLTNVQRETIIDLVLEHNIYTKYKLIQLLEYFIACNGKSTVKDMKEAIYKWEHDIDYIKSKIN